MHPQTHSVGAAILARVLNTNDLAHALCLEPSAWQISRKAMEWGMEGRFETCRTMAVSKMRGA